VNLLEKIMSVSLLMEDVMKGSQYLPAPEYSVAVYELSELEHDEVLGFLAERPIHTVAMTGLIRDNGLQSEHNRGTFYGCRNSLGRLEGVALIGHHTLIEARTRAAVREFAAVAQSCPTTYMILGELDTVEEFWNQYADEGQQMRLVCRELLFELREAVGRNEDEREGPRLATPEDLNVIVPVHAGLAEAESGINPLDRDAEGFRRRCLRRIEQRRTWVVVENRTLLFKADVQADTSEVIYLEGVYVHPSLRGEGTGRHYMNHLCRHLLAFTRRICLLANEENQRSHRFYRMCGFKLRGLYDTIFLRQNVT
jgi:predicted GNAT family acetyltransferase